MGYTCSASDNARFSACKDTYYKDSSGKADICRPHSTCGQAVPGSVTTARATATAGTATADKVCAACAAGTYATGNGACGPCATVDGSLAETALTCTSGSDSRVVACAVDKQKNAGVDATVTVTATHDTCTTPQAACLAIAGADTLRATTAAATATKDIVCAACVAGSFGGNGVACTACTAVDGDLSTADVTCTSLTDSRTSACAATTTTKKTVGADGATDTCTATCAVAGTWDNSNVCTACTAVAGASSVSCTSATDSAVAFCMDGYFKNADGDACTKCTAVTNAATVTCKSAADSEPVTCNDGVNFLSTIDGVKSCGACDAIANAAVTCTWPGNSQLASCNDKFELKSGACTAVVVPETPAA